MLAFECHHFIEGDYRPEYNKSDKNLKTKCDAIIYFLHIDDIEERKDLGIIDHNKPNRNEK